MSKAGTCANYMKEANSLKTVMYLFKYPIKYIYEEFLDAKQGVILCN